MMIRLSHYSLCFVLFTTLAHATSYNCATFSAPNNVSPVLTNIMGINNTGTFVGFYTVPSITAGCLHDQACHGFRADSSGNFTTVDYPGAANTQLMAVNNNGVATGRYSSATVNQGWFTVTASGVFTAVGVPQPYSLVSIYGINDNGAISAVVGTASGNSFAILQPNGSVTLVPGYNAGTLTEPGSINNTPLMLETSIASSGSQLVDSTGNITPVSIPHAFGLNNAGTVVGYQGPGIAAGAGGNVPSSGFSADSSGVVSDVLCPGLPPGFSLAITRAINDNGIVAGGVHILTPLPGQPQINLSANNLTFPPTPVGQTSPPQYVTVDNTGNARLDIGAITSSSSEFRFSGCVNPATGTTSLDPMTSCRLAVTATPSATGSRSGTLTFADSAPGSPGQVAVSVTGTAAAPSCAFSSFTVGPPAQATFTMQDTNSGLMSITLLDSNNANVSIPSFAQGTTSPVTAGATQTDSSQPSKVDFHVTNVAGGAATCGATFGGPTQWTGLGGSVHGKIAVARNTDGRLQIFVRGGDNGLWTIAQAAPDNGWSSWVSLGGVLGGDPVVGLNSDGRLQVFALGSDNSLWTIPQTTPGGSWSSWQSLGGLLASDPAVAIDGNSDLEVVGAGADHALWTIAQISPGGSWSAWSSLAGVMINNPALAANQDGRLEAFVLGPDNTMWTITQSSPGGSWSGWSGLGGSLSGDPVIGVNQDGRLQVFAGGTDSALWTAAQNSAGGSWSAFSSLGGFLASLPAVASNSDGRLEVFARGGDNALWRLSQSTPGGSWSAWATLNGVLQLPVSAAQNQDGRLAAFVEGGDGTLWTIEQIAPGFWN